MLNPPSEMFGKVLPHHGLAFVRTAAACLAVRRSGALALLCSGLPAVLMFALMLHATPASATYIPGLGDIPNGYYYTTDMDPVKVTLSINIRDRVRYERLAEFEMPRAYIYLSSLHSEKDFPELPSVIETRSIDIALTFPEGLAYTVALDQVQRRIASERRNGNLQQASAAAQLRPFLITAQISGSGPDAYNSATFRPRDYEKILGDYGRLSRHSTLGISEVYFGQSDDLIRKIWCPRGLDKANPRHLCTYYTVLSPNVIAKVSFVDFRVHGGLAFAEERIRALKATVCRYIDCD